MDWTRFNTHGDSPERAFEALVGRLFERWCQEEYGDQLEQVAFVNGAGGDGGVEAYATLRDGTMAGLQAKWFREPLDANRLDQVRKSFKTAVQVRPQLVRYIVALPRDLGDRKADKRVRTTERQRWEGFVEHQGRSHPGLDIELWDESRLTQLLAAPRNEGLTRYWFDRTVISLEDLRLAFDTALRWALRTPLGVRLFAELYKGQSFARLSLDEASLVRLMYKKLDYVEQAVRELDPDGWSAVLSPVRHSLRALARECLRQGRPLSTQEALQAAASRLRPAGMFSQDRLLQILDQCRDRGLLLVRSESFDGFPDEEGTWEPAYQVLMDYLLAEEACQLALEDLEAPKMPDYLQQRFEAQAMAVSLLEAKGHRFYESLHW